MQNGLGCTRKALYIIVEGSTVTDKMKCIASVERNIGRGKAGLLDESCCISVTQLVPLKLACKK